jgi:hypothetical protein
MDGDKESHTREKEIIFFPKIQVGSSELLRVRGRQ